METERTSLTEIAPFSPAASGAGSRTPTPSAAPATLDRAEGPNVDLNRLLFARFLHLTGRLNDGR